MCKKTVTKIIKESLPEIIRYGTSQIMLQSSVRPHIKISTSSAIKILKQVAFHHKIVSLSANQIGLDERIFVALKPKLIKAGKWRNYGQQLKKNEIENAEDGYQAIINPLQTTSTYQEYFDFEECPSFQGLKFKVKMPIFINIKYITEENFKNFIKSHQAKDIQLNIPETFYQEETISGFKGRVWDHQIRHLEGLLPIHEEICKGQFYLLDDYKQQMQNIEYYEQLKQTQEIFGQKNLQKVKRQRRAQLRERGVKKQNFNIIPEVIEQKLKRNNLRGKKMKSSPESPSPEVKNVNSYRNGLRKQKK